MVDKYEDLLLLLGAAASWTCIAPIGKKQNVGLVFGFTPSSPTAMSRAKFYQHLVQVLYAPTQLCFDNFCCLSSSSMAYLSARSSWSSLFCFDIWHHYQPVPHHHTWQIFMVPHRASWPPCPPIDSIITLMTLELPLC